ncbi:MAG: hypothetical protein KDJ36_11015, partial [Hyphomicrobiaceae bacterium]|nr:hypothetical protein [Hyphomicrobiaceae bacterium]
NEENERRDKAIAPHLPRLAGLALVRIGIGSRSRRLSYSFYEQFESRYTVGFETRLLRKITLLSGLHPTKIIVSAGGGCTNGRWFSYLESPGRVVRRRLKRRCKSASAARATSFDYVVPALVEEAAGDTRDAGIDLRGRVDGLLRALLGARGGRVSYLHRGPRYVEAVLSGVRGLVIEHGRAWETVLVTVSAETLGGGTRVRVFTDGMAARDTGPEEPGADAFVIALETTNKADLERLARKVLATVLAKTPDKQ